MRAEVADRRLHRQHAATVSVRVRTADEREHGREEAERAEAEGAHHWQSPGCEVSFVNVTPAGTSSVSPSGAVWETGSVSGIPGATATSSEVRKTGAPEALGFIRNAYVARIRTVRVAM